MKLNEIVAALDAEVLVGEENGNIEIDFGYSCDLMSDVLAYVQNNVILLTGLVHQQVIRTAEMLDIQAILIVRGKMPNEDIQSMAQERNISLIRTRHSLFTASGILYENGLLGEEIAHDEINI